VTRQSQGAEKGSLGIARNFKRPNALKPNARQLLLDRANRFPAVDEK
jgi:hypothetical protein